MQTTARTSSSLLEEFYIFKIDKTSAYSQDNTLSCKSKEIKKENHAVLKVAILNCHSWRVSYFTSSILQLRHFKTLWNGNYRDAGTLAQSKLRQLLLEMWTWSTLKPNAHAVCMPVQDLCNHPSNQPSSLNIPRYNTSLPCITR